MRLVWTIFVSLVLMSIVFWDVVQTTWASGFTKMVFSMPNDTVWGIVKIFRISRYQELSFTVLFLSKIWLLARDLMDTSMSGSRENYLKGKTLIQDIKFSAYTLQPTQRYLLQGGRTEEWSFGKFGRVWLSSTKDNIQNKEILNFLFKVSAWQGSL